MARERWTLESLYVYMTALFADRDTALQAALASQNRRLDGMNEFRDSLDDAQKTYVARGEFYAFIAVSGVVGGIIGHYIK